MKEVDNSLFKSTINIGAGKVKQILWYFINELFFKNSLNVVSALKVGLLQLFGGKIGKGVVIKPGVNIKYPWKLYVGDHSWIGENVWIDNLSDVRIGSNVTLSQGALLLTGSHDHRKATFDFFSKPIIIEDGTWICAKAIVLGGVTCHTHSVLAAGGLAESDLKPYMIYKGNPSIEVKARNIS